MMMNRSAPASSGTMSEELVSGICKSKGGYRTPHLNEKLYLHFHGFRKIEGLEAFVNCRALWLENNLLTEIGDGLRSLTSLDSLFVQHNMIRSLSTNMTAMLKCVKTLNISYNMLRDLDGVEMLPNLEKLLASHNEISDVSGIGSLGELSVLDLSHNEIVDAPTFRELVRKSKKLASLMIHGNGITAQVKHYRKTMIAENANLKFLDEYPIFDDERRCAEAFLRGGLSFERETREKIRQEETERQRQQRHFFDTLVETAKKRRESDPNPPMTSYFVQMQEEVDEIEVYIPRCTTTTTPNGVRPPLVRDVNENEIFAHPRPKTKHVDPFQTTDEYQLDEGDILRLFQLDPTTQSVFASL